MPHRLWFALAVLGAVAGCQSLGSVPAIPAAYGPAPDGTVGLIGSGLTPGIDDADRRAGLDAEYRALEQGDTGVAIQWHGPGASGSVVPGPRYQVNDTDCRQFTHTVTIGETMQSGRATACRAADGVWRIVA